MAALWRYRRERSGVAERWRAAHPELSSWARWERVLGLAQAGGTAAAEGRSARAPDRRERAA